MQDRQRLEPLGAPARRGQPVAIRWQAMRLGRSEPRRWPSSLSAVVPELPVEMNAAAIYHESSADVRHPPLWSDSPMMVRCPNCGHSGKLPSNVQPIPGRIRCPSCGRGFDTQAAMLGQRGLSDAPRDLATGPRPESEEEAIEIPDDGLGNLNIDVSEEYELSGETGPPISLPPAPWFYGFLDAWGNLYLVAAGLILAAVLIGLLASVLGAIPNVHALGLWELLAVALVVAPILIFLLTCAAVIFLIVDQARNIRRLTLHAERMESILRSESRKRP